MSDVAQSQCPLSGRPAATLRQHHAIVTHPAFRLGFLDAKGGRAFDHDAILARIRAETPENALKRLGWSQDVYISGHDIEVAQVRYEEGRRAWIVFRPRVRAWGHPDFPPVAVRALVASLAQERRGAAGSAVQRKRGPS